jgi:Dolichyl-phosphate-mannose-protein mannosyltransferase
MRSSAHAALAPYLALVVIIAGACLLAAGSWRVYSNTWDEPEHLAAGIELLDRGRYEYDTEHPPLGRALLALGPWLAGAHSFGTPPPEGTQEGVDILYSHSGSGGHYWKYLTLARLGTLPFLALLLLATWLWARRLLEAPWAAVLAVLLLASVPPVLGHGGLASLDVAAAATILLALYALERWVTSARLADAALFGLAAGVAVATKFSAVPFIGVSLMGLALIHAVARIPFGRLLENFPISASDGENLPPLAPHARAQVRELVAGLAVAAVATLVPIFLAYGPRAANPEGVALRFNWAVAYLLQRPGLDHALGVALSHLYLPRELKDFVNGVVAVAAHNDSGHLSYLLGETRLTGWWYFYLVALAVKTPIPLLAAGTGGLGWLAVRGWRAGDSWALAPLTMTIAILVFASAFSRINIGIRHILVLYPFLALGAAYLALRAWHALAAMQAGPTRIATGAAFLALLVWQLSNLWRAYPDYLPYFNEAVTHPERVLVDSDLDWGQDLYRLEQRAAQLRIPFLNIAYRGTADLAQEPLPPYRVLPPRQPVRGWVAVSELARTRNTEDYAWLNCYTPRERIGKTIDLYYIP